VWLAGTCEVGVAHEEALAAVDNLPLCCCGEMLNPWNRIPCRVCQP